MPSSRWGRRPGTTFATRHTPDLVAAFPPPANQHGPSHWPLARLVVAHELASGCAVRPEYGPPTDDEVTLAVRLLDRLPPAALLLADRTVGIFAFHFAAAARGFQVLTRLTAERFEAMERLNRSKESAHTVCRRPNGTRCVPTPLLPSHDQLGNRSNRWLAGGR